MELPIHGVAASPRHTLRSPPDRYLSFSYSPASSSAGDDELTEHDIFDTATEPPSPGPGPGPGPGPENPNPNHVPRHHHTNFGILAALPGSDSRSVFNHKASSLSASVASSSSSSSSNFSNSSSRMIPRRPPVVEHKRSLLHQSAPVNVPVLSMKVEEERRRRRGVVDDEEEEEGGEVQMLPPHEMVAARDTPVVACSVLEGVGRTLKGRDLRRVRNAVFRKTGFID